jgi:hypothetical protein
MDRVIRRMVRLLGLAVVSIAVVSSVQAQEYVRSIETAPDEICEIVVPSEGTFTTDRDVENIIEAEIEEEFAKEGVKDVRTPIFDLCCMCPEADPFFRDTHLDYGLNFAYYEFNSVAAMSNMLTYTSGWYNDFFQIGGNVTSVASLNPGGGIGSPGLLKNGHDSYTALRRAYAKFQVCGDFCAFDEARLTVFRQGIRAPFIGDGGLTSFVQNDFEAYVLEFDDLFVCGFDVKIGWFDRMRTGTYSKNDDNQEFRSMSQVAFDNETFNKVSKPIAPRGVVSLMGAYEPFTDFTFGGAYHHCQDIVDVLYGDIKYTYCVNEDLSIQPTAQIAYQGPNHQNLMGISSTSFWGLELDVDWCGLIASVMYTDTYKNKTVVDYWGDHPGYCSMIISDFTFADEQALGFGINYDFGRWCMPGLKVDANYVFGRRKNHANGNEREMNLTLDYIFPQPCLQGLWIRGRAIRRDQGNSGNFFFDGHSGSLKKDGVVRDYRIIVYYTKAIL